MSAADEKETLPPVEKEPAQQTAPAATENEVSRSISSNSNDEKALAQDDKDTVVDMKKTDDDEAEKQKKEEEEKKAVWGSYARVWGYATPVDRFFHVIGFLASFGAGAALPMMTIVFGELINVFNNWGQFDESGNPKLPQEKFRKEINQLTLYFVYLFIGKFFLVYIHTSVFTITATRITSKIRIKYIQSLLRQEIAYFDTCTPGSTSTRITTSANQVHTGLGEKVGVASQAIAMLVSAFIVAFVKQWKLTLVTATTLPAVVVLVGATVGIDMQFEQKVLDSYAKAGGLAEEVLATVRNVVAFGAHGKLLSKYEAYLDVAKKFGVKKGPVLGIQYSSEFSIMYCAYALSFWYGIKLLLSGEIPDGGTVFIVFFCCIIATSSLTMIAPSIGSFTNAAAAAKDILDVIDRVPEIDSTDTKGLKPSECVGRMEVKNVTFQYPARKTLTVLDDISLVLEERKTTALVGASGSGKSTIVALAERWYDPVEGEVTLDGHNIKNLNLRWLRTQIGLVQQEPMLFNDTVYANVAYGMCGTAMVDLPEDEKRRLVKEACIEANADSFIEALPEGYDTLVGERAGLLSGGQKQRIAIARSIVKNPSILLLDEATSALDPKAEAVVQAALDKASKSRTTVMVSHRLSTVKKADKIVVMNKGKIVETGTHESLLAAEGAYYRLVRAQNLHIDSAGDGDRKDGESGSITESHSEVDVAELDRVETQKSVWSAKSAYKGDDDLDKRYGLLYCLWIIFSEHKHLWGWYVGGVFGSVLGGVIFPVQAILFAKLVTVFQHTGAKLKERGDFWALMFFCLAIVTFFSYGSIGLFWTMCAFKMTRVYRAQYFKALMSQDIAFYDLPENSSGALTSRLSSDPQNVHDLIQGNTGLILVVIVNLFSSVILAFAYGWKLALVAVFGALPPIFAAGFMRMRLELTANERLSKFFVESARFASEAVGAIRTVSSLTLEDEVLGRYSEKLQGPIRNAYKRTLLVMILFGLSDSVDMLGNALAFWYGGRLVSTGEYDPVKFFTVFAAVLFGGQAAGFLFGYTSNLTKAHGASNHIINMREKKPPINASTGDSVPADAEGTPFIEFKDLRFTYPTRPTVPVLRRLNLKISHGETIGLVGASGCGKTTVISLLERFYDATGGEILINGAPLTSLNVHAYRAKLALVAQEPTLYQGSIKDNILLGTTETDVPHELVVKAATDANIHTFIQSLPEGYDTDVGSKGLALSGGQRQRLAIARALIRNPEMLLLDEATSALDTESEKSVQAAIENASKGRTTLIIAHRLSTIRNADRIVVFEAGRIVEQGNHEELWERRGVYWNMCQGQSLDREAQ